MYALVSWILSGQCEVVSMLAPMCVINCPSTVYRYHYSIDKELCAAASSDSVRLNLMRKVSRERFGIEVEKMLSESVGCVEGIGLLCYWG